MATKHKWTARQAGGRPDDAGSQEYVGFCEVCGIEGSAEEELENEAFPPCSGPLPAEEERRYDRAWAQIKTHDRPPCNCAACADAWREIERIEAEYNL